MIFQLRPDTRSTPVPLLQCSRVILAATCPLRDRLRDSIPLRNIQTTHAAIDAALRLRQNYHSQCLFSSSLVFRRTQMLTRRLRVAELSRNFLIFAVAMHGKFEALRGAKHVRGIGGRVEATKDRRFQCVPPWPGLALCSSAPPTLVNFAEGESGSARRGTATFPERTAIAKNCGIPFENAFLPEPDKFLLPDCSPPPSGKNRIGVSRH